MSFFILEVFRVWMFLTISFEIFSGVNPNSSSISDVVPCFIKTSGYAKNFLSLTFSSLMMMFSTAEASPPVMTLSSIVMIFCVFLNELSIVDVSSGFRKRAFITSAVMFFFFSISATFIAVTTVLPSATIVMSLPSSSISAFPSFISFCLFPSFSTYPSLGYLMAIGALYFIAKFIMFENSVASFGAIIVMFGMCDRYDRSYIPWCVSPSEPTIPALSIARITCAFCNAMSCIISSYPRCRNVE